MFAIGAPPSSSTKSAVLGSVKLTSQCSDALAIGREALQRLGGIVKDAVADTKEASGFDMDLIVIPVGVTPQNLGNYTLYDMLGFTPEWADSADTEAIKKAYHKAVLMYHPDKAQFKTSGGEEDQSVFLKIQEAFKVLCDEKLRRAYDSQLPFDERIPAEEKVDEKMAKNPLKFFKLFDPVFKRNARFAVKKPVPDLGDMETPMDQVHKFYTYWINFESWRDFTGVDAEYNPESASSRQEKRYMQQENEKLAKKKKKLEMDRIIELVMLAQKKDPRVVADKLQKQEAKDAAKNAKEAEKNRREEEERTAKEWAAAQEEGVVSTANMTKAEKDKYKKSVSNARNLFRKLLRACSEAGHGDNGEYGILNGADCDVMCANCDLEDLNTMNNAMGGVAASKDKDVFKADGIQEVLSRVEVMQERANQSTEDERIVRDMSRKEAEEAKNKPTSRRGNQSNANVPPPEKEWSPEGLQCVAKSLKRYPAGFNNRWQMIYYYVNDTLKPAEMYTETEVMIAAWKSETKPSA